jgi:hypothetical protein
MYGRAAFSFSISGTSPRVNAWLFVADFLLGCAALFYFPPGFKKPLAERRNIWKRKEVTRQQDAHKQTIYFYNYNFIKGGQS